MGVMKTILAVNLLGNGHHESNEDQRVRNLVGDGHGNGLHDLQYIFQKRINSQ
ncbi:hypothetical protein M3607_04175 [Metabacillus litoralis]|nr:hypothetical protein [Metabacillus litoralis]